MFKRAVFRAALAFAAACHTLPPAFAQQVHTTVLDSGWRFRQQSAADSPWLPAAVPGDVHLDLLRNKLIPEPFFGQNETALQWIETADWTYSKTWTLSADELNHKHVELLFQGLDTTATVLLNGHDLLHANNMFRPWRVDAKPFLHPGENTLEVRFRSDVKEGERLAAEDPTRSETHIPEKAYVRKAAYEYGWDWGPRFVTSGIWQPVELQTWDAARIERIAIEQPDVSPASAHLVAKIIAQADTDTDADLTLKWSQGAGAAPHTQHAAVHLHGGQNTLALPVEIAHPALWYPNGYGAQPMYTFHAALAVAGHPQDEAQARTGLRKIVLLQPPDQWGRAFFFQVNGIPIFIKGADVIPFDSFPTRVTEANYRSILGAAQAAHMNMIRLWGGGYYESDTFYNLCDELGLMVWQDFMFASSWYPGTEEWKQSVRDEAEYQVGRLRNHPSIALWSGNNEVESVLNAFLGGLGADGRLQVWKNYLTTFSGVLPRVTEQLTPEIPLWPSSPSSDYEKTTDTFQAGDAHDWSIWHGREPFSNYRKHFFRFNSEYGFQSFPELATVASFTTPDDRKDIFTPTMLAHQKNNEGNAIIHEYMLRDYAEPKDFPSFLYVSQVLQAEGVKVGAEHMRRNRGRIMGSLYWQLNDCWPVASWSSIDSFGRWKALQYYARRFYSPVLVSPNVEDGKAEVFVISDRTAPFTATLRARLLTLDGHVVHQEAKQITVPALSAASYLEYPLTALAAQAQDLSDLVLAVDVQANGETLSDNLTYLAPTKQVHLPAPHIQTTLARTAGGFAITLRSQALARDVYLTLGSLQATLSDNYLDLLPNEPRTVTITTPASEDELKQALQVTSLAEAFGPKAATP